MGAGWIFHSLRRGVAPQWGCVLRATERTSAECPAPGALVRPANASDLTVTNSVRAAFWENMNLDQQTKQGRFLEGAAPNRLSGDPDVLTESSEGLLPQHSYRRTPCLMRLFSRVVLSE